MTLNDPGQDIPDGRSDHRFATVRVPTASNQSGDAVSGLAGSMSWLSRKTLVGS
jgi:hypothetical protein